MPMKVLNYRTPNEVWDEEVAKFLVSQGLAIAA